ncbi:MAG TPA: right-handed parallel beta-helix repeat-containing protein, partial [Ilumatobacteraceae bacterium]|nr:right-handed parallel beta-helix repeat-containing protein [Ilumatobacteraceae bacterium]
EGIYVGDPASAGIGNIIDNNTTNNNIADGIHVGNIGHVVSRNTANHNGGWGIYAATATVSGGNIDGGGNAAIGNVGGGLDPFTLLTIECFNIVCDGTAPLASDPVRPETWTIEAPANPSASTSATFAFGGIDNATRVRFECRLDSTDAGDFADCTSPMTLSGLALGSHTFEVRAVDFSGNVDASPATHTWVVIAPPNGVAPVATLVSTPDTATPSTGATFAFSANEADATFECRLDGAAYAPCTSPRTYTALAVGAHTFEVRAVDAEGLASAAVSWPWRVTAAPVPTAVTCGRVLTQSTLVTNDLHDCPGNGLVVGAHNITVDLGGHTIDGVQSGVGIQNNGFDSVVITNGSVQEFETGIRLNPGTTLNVVSGMTFTMTKLGAVYLSDADRTTMRDLELTMNETGIVISAGTQNAVLRDSAIGLTAKQGVWINSSPGTRVENTTISASSEAAILLEGSTGTSIVGNRLTGIQKEAVAVTLGSHTTLIERNTMTGNAGGVRIFESNFALLLSNVIDGNDDGIFMEKSNDSVVRANDVRMNGSGIEAKDVNRTRFELNNVSGNSGSGIFLDGASIGNQLVLNVASGNDGEGIDIPASGSSSNRTVVDRNITNGNGSGGIFATGAHRLSNNQADFNDGWGIYAESGTVDGGGNNALGNSEPVQCVGVACLIGINPSAPNTSLLEHPTNPSNSRSASFLFTGTDDTTALVDLEFECRLDTTNELAWTECENPALYSNLAPGSHTFEVRALDIAENPDPTPANFTWTYQPLVAGVAPDTTIEIAPPLGTPLFEAVFKFYANEPDVTFECSLDGAAFAACANEPEMIEANWFIAEYEFEEHEVGEHTFRVRARDFEGNVDATPATHTWSILGALAIITDGPAFEPGDPGEPGEPPSGGETESRTATFVFHANIPDAVFECSLDLAVYAPCESPVTYTDLAVGEHVFIVIAIDPEGEWVSMEEGSEYEWTILPSVDQEPPTTLILDGPDSGTAQATVTFIGGDDVTSSGGLVFECRLDSVVESDWFECISPLNLLDELGEPLAAGPHTIDVRAVDLEDNVDPTPARHSWTAIADTVSPTTELLTHPAASALVDVDVSFTFTGADNATSALGLTFECSLDNAEYEACESPHEVQGTEPGEHTMRVRAVDMALNVDATPAEWTWLVIGAPDTTLDVSAAPPAAPAVTTDTSALFTFAADQAGSTFGCALNGSEFTRCASPLELLGLGGGAYLLEVRATNEFGLVEDEPAAHEWIVDAGPDTTTPETAISSGPPAETTATTATISFVSSELGSSFECALVPLEPDAVASFSSCTSPFQATDLPGGEHTFLVRAMDLAGNVDPTPDEWSWTVAAPPITTIVTGPEDGTESSVATFTFVSSVAGAQFYCALDVPPFEECTSPVTYTGIGIGDHEFVVYSVAGGFADTDGDGWEWEVVVDAPIDTGITAGPPSVTGSTSANFEFASTEGGSTFECALDGGPWVACTSPRTVSGLGLGSHTFAVRAIGPTGEVDATPATATWEVVAPDVTAPNTLITEAPPATTDQLVATFRFASTETGSTFACSLDGEAPEPCVSPFVILDLEVGGHTFTVAATDAAGNTDPTPAEHPWTVVADTVAPETIIVDGPTGIIGDNVAAVTFTGSDNVTLPIDLEFECSLNGEPFGGCDSPTLLEDLAVGPHTFAVRAIDDADVPNVDPTPATIEWTVLDTIAPETSIDSGPEDPTDSAAATFAFSGEHLEPTTDPTLTFACSLDAGDFTDCASPYEITVGIGLHTFDVRAIDGAGNADATPERYEWTALGPDAPDTFIDAAPDETIQGELALFAFSSSLPETAVEFECSLDGAPYESCESPHELEGLAIG